MFLPQNFPNGDATVGKLEPLGDARDTRDANAIADLFLWIEAQKSSGNAAFPGLPRLDTKIARTVFKTYWETPRSRTLQKFRALGQYPTNLPYSKEAFDLVKARTSSGPSGASALLNDPATPRLKPNSLVLEHVAPIMALTERIKEVRKDSPDDSPNCAAFLHDHYRLAVLTKAQADAIDRTKSPTTGNALRQTMPVWTRFMPFIRYQQAHDTLSVKAKGTPTHFDFTEMCLLGT